MRAWRSRLPSAKRRLACGYGYSLPEMLTVMVILGIVLGGLTAMFHAGVRAEVRANKELDAQQHARAALDKMRRELHCASAISASPEGTAVATMTVTLPAGCPGTDTTVVYATTNVSTDRYQLTRTGNSGTPSKVADYLTTGAIFTYQVVTSGELRRLSVDIPVNLDTSDPGTLWRLRDDIVLRNTTRS
jgi:prepilin-type N-terminal cleavage/methylation domain-containing protein